MIYNRESLPNRSDDWSLLRVIHLLLLLAHLGLGFRIASNIGFASLFLIQLVQLFPSIIYQLSPKFSHNICMRIISQMIIYVSFGIMSIFAFLVYIFDDYSQQIFLTFLGVYAMPIMLIHILYMILINTAGQEVRKVIVFSGHANGERLVQDEEARYAYYPQQKTHLEMI